MFESLEGADLISRICVNKFFCSAAGISQKGAVTCIEQHELPAKQSGLKAAIDADSAGRLHEIRENPPLHVCQLK